jgi:hypothetical protein
MYQMKPTIGTEPGRGSHRVIPTSYPLATASGSVSALNYFLGKANDDESQTH